MTNGDWDEYGKLVLSELKRLDRNDQRIENKLDHLAVDLAMLKTKSAGWGMVSGALMSIIIGLVLKFFNGG